ncbi:MAG: hypothetical protein ACRC5C_09120 [Bacilli bacterium]
MASFSWIGLLISMLIMLVPIGSGIYLIIVISQMNQSLKEIARSLQQRNEDNTKG